MEVIVKINGKYVRLDTKTDKILDVWLDDSVSLFEVD